MLDKLKLSWNNEKNEKKIHIHITNKNEWEKFKKFCLKKWKDPEKYLLKIQEDMWIATNEKWYFWKKTIKYLNNLYDKQNELLDKIWTKNSLNNLKSEILKNKKIDLTKEDKKELREFVLPVTMLFNKKVTNENLQALNKTVQASQEKIEDWLYKKFDVKDWWYLTRLLFLSSITALSVDTWYNMSIVQHEWSHWKTAKLNWAEDVYYWWQSMDGSNKSKWKKTLWQIFLYGMAHPFSIRITYYEWKIKNKAAFNGAWLNMQQFIANENNKQWILNWKNSSLSSNINYLLNKSSWLRYSLFMQNTTGNDITSYISNLREKWINISKKDIIKYQAAAFLLSWWTWNSLNNLWKFIKDWKKDHENINLIEYNGYKFSLPELSTFMNSDNFSLEIMEYISKWNFTYELWFETPVIGKWKNTYTIWINKQKENWDKYSWRLTTNWKATEVQLRYTKKINKNSSLEIYWNKWFWKTNIWSNRPDKNYWEDSFWVNYILRF